MKFNILITITTLVVWLSGCMHTIDKPNGNIIKIGIVAPLTGMRADAGGFMRNALSLAQEEIDNNVSRKYKVELVFEDSQYQPEIAVAAVNKLIGVDKVDYIIGPYGSSQVLAVAPIVEQSQTILITPGAQADNISGLGDYVFRLIHHAKQEAPIFAEFIVEKMQSDTIHFLAIKNAFADSYFNNLRPVLEKANIQIGTVEYFEPTQTDFRSQLTKIKLGNPTDIFPIATPKQMGMILVQAHELDIDANFYHIGVEGPELIEIARDLAEGIYYPYSYDNKSEAQTVREFYNKYLDKYKKEPDTVAANSYDALFLLSNCFEEVGNNAQLVKNCLYRIDNYQGAGGVFSIDESGDVVKEIIIKTVRDGKFVTLKEVE